jgi:hypothetical protein
MKVGELIKKLQAFDPDMIVRVSVEFDIGASFTEEINDVLHLYDEDIDAGIIVVDGIINGGCDSFA